MARRGEAGPGADDRETETLTDRERDRLAAIRDADGLDDLVALTGADTEHEAYFEAKREFESLRRRTLGDPTDDCYPGERVTDGFPADRVTVGGHEFFVHGITHADTDAERAFVREHVTGFLEAGATVYCEQGIRPMYLDDVGGVCAMDDYRWASRECERLDADTRLDDAEFDHLIDLAEFAGEFREAAFSLIDSGSDLYGDRFASALGDVASEFLTDHGDAATGADFESFSLTRRAAADPAFLLDLQDYYRRSFLPQPVEREWLRRHDPELELVTHARNERMADYAVYHNETVPEVHLLVGAAHQPGVAHYLRAHRDGRRSVDGFELA